VAAHPIHDKAAFVIQQLGGKTANFAARQLTAKIASDADLVLAMTRSHRDAVLELAPHQFRKTFMLSEAAQLVSKYNGQNVEHLAAFRPHLAPHLLWDIPDPLGESAKFFAMVGSQIAELLPPIVELCRPHRSG
jgi:protein-tyrosine phosphatase